MKMLMMINAEMINWFTLAWENWRSKEVSFEVINLKEKSLLTNQVGINDEPEQVNNGLPEWAPVII